MKTYTAYLVRWKNRNKEIHFSAINSTAALKHIADNYPDWQISMFWMDWPQK
jgi:hypothetical protein